MVLTAGYRSTRRKTCPTVTLSTKNSIWTDRLSCVVALRLSALPVRRTTTVNTALLRHKTDRSVQYEDDLHNLRESADFPSVLQETAGTERLQLSVLTVLTYWFVSGLHVLTTLSLQQEGARLHILRTSPLHGYLNGRFTFQPLLPFGLSTSYKIIE